MLIDFHVHCFPDALAAGAIKNLAKTSGIIPETHGTIGDTIIKMNLWGVDTAVIQNIAVTPHSEHKVNDFAIEINDLKRIVAFGSVHPQSAKIEYELLRLKDAGVRGIKLHPEYQGFDIDDKIAYPIYELCEKLGLIILFHAGWDVAYPQSRRAYPNKSANIINDFPNLRIVLAHFGANRAADETVKYLVGKNVYFDLALIADFLTPDECFQIIKMHGANKILFGTDCPWDSAAKLRTFVEKMPLSDAEKDMIYYKNALNLLKISECVL